MLVNLQSGVLFIFFGHKIKMVVTTQSVSYSSCNYSYTALTIVFNIVSLGSNSLRIQKSCQYYRKQTILCFIYLSHMSSFLADGKSMAQQTPVSCIILTLEMLYQRNEHISPVFIVHTVAELFS